jgi:hypothetical protein
MSLIPYLAALCRQPLHAVVSESPMIRSRHPRLFPPGFALWGALILAAALGLPGMASAQDWRPARLTILLGHTLDGLDGRITRVLVRVWRRHLRAPVVIAAGGRRSLLKTAGEFTRRPRDGSVVLAGDLGYLALAYARERPDWAWARSFEHLGVFARDPAMMFVAADATNIDDFDDVVRAAREGPYRIGVGHWLSLENLLVHDAAAQAGLQFKPIPIGSGESLLAAVLGGKVPLAFGRLSDVAAKPHAINILAAAQALGPAVNGTKTIDAAIGTVTAPAGRVGVISVHAGFQRAHPARFERLNRSFRAVINDAEYQEALTKLGLTLKGAQNIDHARLMSSVRLWWDAYRRVGAKLSILPAPVITRSKISFVGEGGRVLRYLGLDGKQHDLHTDADETELIISGIAVTGAEPLKAIRIGLICIIARPTAIALEASRLAYQ